MKALMIAKRLGDGAGDDSRPGMVPKGLSGIAAMMGGEPDSEAPEGDPAAGGVDDPLAGGSAGVISPEDAGYVDSCDKCSGCDHFKPPNACNLVSGMIAPEGWCKLYKGGMDATDDSGLAGLGGYKPQSGESPELAGAA